VDFVWIISGENRLELRTNRHKRTMAGNYFEIFVRAN